MLPRSFVEIVYLLRSTEEEEEDLSIRCLCSAAWRRWSGFTSRAFSRLRVWYPFSGDGLSKPECGVRRPLKECGGTRRHSGGILVGCLGSVSESEGWRKL